MAGRGVAVGGRRAGLPNCVKCFQMDYFSLMALTEKAPRRNGVGYTWYTVAMAVLSLIMAVSFIKVGFRWIKGFLSIEKCLAWKLYWVWLSG